MPRYAKKTIPAGFAIREFADGTFQAYATDTSKPVDGPIVTRRITAVNWAWVKSAELTAVATTEHGA